MAPVSELVTLYLAPQPPSTFRLPFLRAPKRKSAKPTPILESPTAVPSPSSSTPSITSSTLSLPLHTQPEEAFATPIYARWRSTPPPAPAIEVEELDAVDEIVDL
mgnify:FL=1